MRPQSVPDDGYFHFYECVRILDAPGEPRRCGWTQTYPGNCPYDHGPGVEVPLVHMRAIVQCSDCEMPILRDDCRAPDGRLVCGDCAMNNYLGEGEGEGDLHRPLDNA